MFSDIGKLFGEAVCFLGVSPGYFIVFKRDGLVSGCSLFFVC